MCSVSFRIISSGASNSIVCSIICFLFFVFCSRLALVLYVVCRCCNKVSLKKKKKKKKKGTALWQFSLLSSVSAGILIAGWK